MSKVIDPPLTAEEYEDMAWAYYKTLPLEHFMESIPQSTQRKIALESLDLLHALRPEVQVFSELLVQYRIKGEIRRVVPDNMVRLHDQPPRTKGSFNMELEPVGPFWALEWISPSSVGKDYGEAFNKYEQDLRVPYCLMYYPEELDFRLYRHTRGQYELVPANAAGRYPIPELDLELAILDGWVRFWYQGRLLDLPADLQKRIDELQEQANSEKRLRLAAEEEVARLKAMLAQLQKPKDGPNGVNAADGKK